VTGANSGVGLQIALDLVRQNATVYLACRNMSKANEAADLIRSKVPGSNGKIQVSELDTSDLGSVRAFAARWRNEGTPVPIDVLFHNAGIAGVGPRPISRDGFPITYATNFLGSFLLTHLLEDDLADDARVIFTTSTGQYGAKFSDDFSSGDSSAATAITGTVERGFHVPPYVTSEMVERGEVNDSAYYTQTKAMQVAFAILLQARFDGQHLLNFPDSRHGGRKGAAARDLPKRTAAAFTPSFTSTPIFAKVDRATIRRDPILWLLCVFQNVMATDVEQGAKTGVWLAGTRDERVVNGEGAYWDRCGRRVSGVEMLEPTVLERFWGRWEGDAGVVWR